MKIQGLTVKKLKSLDRSFLLTICLVLTFGEKWFIITVTSIDRNFSLKGYSVMKICPMCSMIQFDFVEKKNPNVCMVPMCGFEDKPADQLTEKEINNLMGAYEYEKLEDGTYRIMGVENLRDIGFRGPVALSQIVSEIDEDAMSHLKFMTIIELPQGLRSIGNEAFASCRDLFKVIPAAFFGDGEHISRRPFGFADDLGGGCLRLKNLADRFLCQFIFPPQFRDFTTEVLQSYS